MKSYHLVAGLVPTAVLVIVGVFLFSGRDRVVKDIEYPDGCRAEIIERDGVEYFVVARNWSTAIPYNRDLVGFYGGPKTDEKSTFGPEHFLPDDLPVIVRVRPDNLPDRIWRAKDGALLWSIP